MPMKLFLKSQIIIYSILLLPLVCIAISCQKTNFAFEGNLVGLGSDNIVKLYAYDGDKLNIIDSVYSKDNSFNFSISPEMKSGMYHVRWGNDRAKGIDFVYNYENISFYAHKESVAETMSFDNSPENELFYAFYPLKLTLRNLIDMGDRLNRENPVKNKPQLLNLNSYIDSLELSIHNMLDELDEESKNLLSYKILKAAFYPCYDFYLQKGMIQEMDAYLFTQMYFFDNIDFNEPSLIRTPFLFNAIEDYINLYVDPMTVEEYKKAADLIMSKSAVNDETYDYVLNLLIRTF